MLTQILLLVICQTIVADNSINKPYYDVENGTLIRDLFENFMKTNSKNYEGAEKEERFQIFVENLKDINYLNEKHQAMLDVDRLADQRPEEKLRYFGFKPEGRFDTPNGKCKVLKAPTTRTAPDVFGWNMYNKVPRHKYQRNCSASWAFSATDLVESRYAMKHNKLLDMSQQQVVDCDDRSEGCAGGSPVSALTKIMEQGGLEAFSDYPYEAAQGKCRFNESKVVIKVTSCTIYQVSTVAELKEVIYTQGPISAATTNNALSGSEGSHDNFILLFGFSTKEGHYYFFLYMAYTDGFGERGQIRIPQGVGDFNLYHTYVSATVE